MTPGSAIRIMPAAAINGISCLGAVELAIVMPLRKRGKPEFMVIIEGTDKSKREERERWWPLRSLRRS
jgi:hypothetical protein